MHRKRPCNVCKGKLFVCKQSLKEKKVKGKIKFDLIYEEKCVACKNLVYGYVKELDNRV